MDEGIMPFLAFDLNFDVYRKAKSPATVQGFLNLA